MTLLFESISTLVEILSKTPKLRTQVLAVSGILAIVSLILWLLSQFFFMGQTAAIVNDMAIGAIIISGFILLIAVSSFSPVQTRDTNRFFREKIAEAESKVDEEPTQVTPAWDLARVTLEAYFSRNLSQITAIFWLSVTVMVVGFAIIIWGISQAIQSPDSIVAASIAAGAGVITEFIGATFLFIYRSAIEQAINYSKTLERINSVGMAMKILDTMPDEAKPDDLKSKTKAKLVELLIQQANKGSEAG